MKTINKELFSQQSCNFKFLAKEGFNTPKYYELETYDDFENIIIDHLNTHKSLGVSGFVQEVEEYTETAAENVFFSYDNIYTTKLTEIVWVSNPSGEIIPTGIFEEISIENKSYTSCSLRNVAYLEKLITSKKMAIGDEIHIVLRDENIPSIIGVAKNNNGDEIAVPTACPVCETTLQLVNYKFVCGNDDCSNKVTFILMNYFELLNDSKLTSKLLTQLVNDFGVTSISDLKALTVAEIGHLPDSNLILEILSKKQTIDKHQLIHLTQPKNNSIGVIGHFMNVADISQLLNTTTTVEDIIDITMVDESSRSELIKAVNNQLVAIRENSQFFNVEGNNSNTLNNHIFCLTNTMKKDTMKHYEKLIVENGGRVGAVSMKLNFLVTNEIDNTKYKKVVETNTKLYNNGKTHSITIIDESDLLKMMEK